MTSLTIPNRGPTETAQDFFALRDQGVELIQHLASETWTDHNLHDPGITFLEAASYAMTDLGYRLDFSVPDWMATTGNNSLPFWQQPHVLPCEPVTANDLRQLILNIPGVRNVMAKPVPLSPWLWRISVIPETGVEKTELIKQVRDVFLQHRNLGEDLEPTTAQQASDDSDLPGLQILDSYDLTIRLKVRISDGKDTVETLAQLLARLAELISPTVAFRSLDELLAKGYSTEQLHTGPWLSRGYLDEAALKQPALKQTLYVSRLMTDALTIEGVEQVDHLAISGASDPIDDDAWEPWIYPLQTSKAPHLNIERTLGYVEVLKKGIAVSFNVADVSIRVAELMQAGESPGRRTINTTGEFRELADYVPIQHELPVVYGVGKAGIAAGESVQRIEQIRRLQAYLLFMDQVLANQFAQLAHANQLMCVPDKSLWRALAELLDKMQGSVSLSHAEISEFWQRIKQLPASHQSQPVAEINGLADILTKSIEEYQSPEFNQLTEETFSEQHITRLNRALEHLLARHHEAVADESVLKYEDVFCNYRDVLLEHPDHLPIDKKYLTRRLAKFKCAVDKALFILDVPHVGACRGQGHHYVNDQIWGTTNVVGVKHRAYRKLGIPIAASRQFSDNNYEGFHCVEGTLLRHGVMPSSYPETAQPHLIFIVLPCWPTRFQNEIFKLLISQTLHEELPVHLSPQLLFLDRTKMAIFEKIYCAWRNAILFVYSSDHIRSRQDRIQVAARMMNECLTAFKQGDDYAIDSNVFINSKIGDKNYPIGNFIIGYQSTELLKYPPNDSRYGCIGRGEINPASDSNQEPFVIRVKEPNLMCSDTENKKSY